MKRIYREMSEAGLPEPSFLKQDFMTITTIKNAVAPQNVPQNVPQNASQQTDIEKIMRLIKESPGVTREQLAQAIGKSTKSVQRLIHDCGCIEHVGSSKTGHWVIKEE